VRVREPANTFPQTMNQNLRYQFEVYQRNTHNQLYRGDNYDDAMRVLTTAACDHGGMQKRETRDTLFWTSLHMLYADGTELCFCTRKPKTVMKRKLDDENKQKSEEPAAKRMASAVKEVVYLKLVDTPDASEDDEQQQQQQQEKQEQQEKKIATPTPQQPIKKNNLTWAKPRWLKRLEQTAREEDDINSSKLTNPTGAADASIIIQLCDMKHSVPYDSPLWGAKLKMLRNFDAYIDALRRAIPLCWPMIEREMARRTFARRLHKNPHHADDDNVDLAALVADGHVVKQLGRLTRRGTPHDSPLWLANIKLMRYLQQWAPLLLQAYPHCREIVEMEIGRRVFEQT